MEFGDMLISTGVDALIKLVREKGKVDLALASRLLNIPVSTIEEWAHALESEGIIAIEYQLTKVYLKWVSPTEEKIEEERAHLEGEKAQLLQLIKEKDKKTEVQLKEVAELKDEFVANYAKIMEKIEELGSRSAAVQKTREGREEDYYKAVDALEELRGKISELRDSVKFVREQLEKTRAQLTGSDIERQMRGVLESRASIAGLKAELEEMEREATKALNSISSSTIGSADVSGLRGALDSVKVEYETLKKEMEGTLATLKGAESASEVLADAKSKMDSLRSSTESAAAELGSLTGTIPEIETRISEISARLKENEEKVQRFAETLKKAEETMKALRPDEKSGLAIEELIQMGKVLGEKMEKFQTSASETLPLFENVDRLISSLSGLRKRIGEERKKLAEESGAIFASLDEEVETYSTFQKIKERAGLAIGDYLNQLEKIEADYEKAAKEAERVEKELDSSLTKFRESGEYKAAEQLSTAMDMLTDKKRALEEIRNGIDALDSSATRVAKQVKLLAKEAELLELRSGTSVSEAREKTKRAGEEIRESLALTESEQKDFDLKREELRKLIKKLWEEE